MLPHWANETLIQQERTLLMGLFNWSEEIITIQRYINVNDFFVHIHGKVFSAMIMLDLRDEVINWDTLPMALTELEVLPEEIEQIVELLDDDGPGVTWDNIQFCASQIAEMSRRRRMSFEIAELYKSSVEGTIDSTEFVKSIGVVYGKCCKIAQEVGLDTAHGPNNAVEISK